MGHRDTKEAEGIVGSDADRLSSAQAHREKEMVTKLATTPNAVTTTMTYEPVFNQVATVTNPLTPSDDPFLGFRASEPLQKPPHRPEISGEQLNQPIDEHRTSG